MKYYELYDGESRFTTASEPKWDLSYDIVVAGGGGSGVSCALSAAREGRKVAVIEKGKWFGGTHIQGYVNGYYYGGRGGIYAEADKKSEELKEKCFYNLNDAKRLTLAKLLQKCGVEAYTSSQIIGIYAKDKQVVGVKARLKNKTVTIKCSMLTDATADGHVLRLLPLSFFIGRRTDNSVQPFSSVRSVYLDKGKYDGGLRVEAGNIAGKYGIFHEYRDNGYINQYDEEAFSREIIRAHASHLDSIDENARFLNLAPLIGVREGALFEGEQFLTLEDVLVDSKKPENVLLYAFSDVDKHGHDLAFDDKTYQDWFVNCNLSTLTVYIPIPVGSVVPKGWSGIISTGRCLSADGYVNAATRMNTDCFRLGEACGVLAAMSVDYSCAPMSVPYEKLKAKLDGTGLFENNPILPPSFWTPALGDNRKFIHWMTDTQEIKEALSTNKPGVALWSCRRLGKEAIGDEIFEMTKSADEMLRLNSAIALGVMNDKRALPILHEIIKNRNHFYFMDCRRSNQMRSVIAISLCGQIGDTGIIDELLEIIKPEEFEKNIYHELLEPCYELTITKELNAVYYHHFSHAVAALVKIAEANPQYRENITGALHEALDDEAYIRRMTDMPQYNAYYKAALNCKRFFVNRLCK